MPRSFFGVLLLLFFLCGFKSQGQSPVCPNLETIRMGKCVPSNSAVCHSGQPFNCEVADQKLDCPFVNSGSFYKKLPEGGVDAQCVDWEWINDCPPGQDTCQPRRGQCIRYLPPTCALRCIKCYDEIKMDPIANVGCNRFCGEEYCRDESVCPNIRENQCNGPYCFINICPIQHSRGNDPAWAGFVSPQDQHDECKPSETCPTRVSTTSSSDGGTLTPENCPECVFENGQVVVSVTDPDCTPAVVRPRTVDPGIRPSCPWIRYAGGAEAKATPFEILFGIKKATATECPTGYRWTNASGACGCADVEVGNRFPQDCCECGASPCQTCNFDARETERHCPRR